MIPLEMAGLRLDRALALMLPEESRSRLSRAIEEGQVRIEGREVSGSMKLKSGESVEVALEPRGAGDENRPEAMDLAVVHEDEDVLVVEMGDAFRVLATNTMRRQSFIASPVIVDGDIYLRSRTHLFRIGG